ncbi:uncharacterized protein OCT59_027107 [Rhizophagus irregularis]|uniref:F-box domain-containing protein n=2 Tax=Rhizophagus irregularis TaxID=588596 RepID=A0A015N146_RHIIW|nr:hypothetical protein RirG_065920 [Rhizophagus irregularis DAOM 197198w]UZO06798.1 hypothetical protein OCT59_027107 [Rhizophagus irregularis]GBC45455.1 hypothetical protein GLOIN_2v1876445 [Rhizophagus irregularis DAOM 181602=DAOM 197198]
MVQLPIDCMNQILEYFTNDSRTLISCLLVNRYWCKATVRIYWEEIRNYKTLIACLPNESKEILNNNGILIPTSNPLFNYVSFCKSLSLGVIICNIERFLKKQMVQNISDSKVIVSQEIFKLLMSQIYSLKTLKTLVRSIETPLFTSYPGARDCLKNISELQVYSNYNPAFFHQLSQICHNIRSLEIIIITSVSNGLSDLISAQQNLKHLQLIRDGYSTELRGIETLAEVIPNNLISIDIYGRRGFPQVLLTCIPSLINLQSLTLTFYIKGFFEELQHAIFPQLQTLEFKFECPEDDLLIKFLENNGKNLKRFHVQRNGHTLNLAVIDLCPNLNYIATKIMYDIEPILKLFINSFQYLKYIDVYYEKSIFTKNNITVITKGLTKNYLPEYLPHISFCKIRGAFEFDIIHRKRKFL